MDLRLLPDLPYEARRTMLEACSFQFDAAEEICEGICKSPVRCPFCDARPWTPPTEHAPVCPVYRWGRAKRLTKRVMKKLMQETRASA